MVEKVVWTKICQVKWTIIIIIIIIIIILKRFFLLKTQCCFQTVGSKWTAESCFLPVFKAIMQKDTGHLLPFLHSQFNHISEPQFNSTKVFFSGQNNNTNYKIKWVDSCVLGLFLLVFEGSNFEIASRLVNFIIFQQKSSDPKVDYV